MGGSDENRPSAAKGGLHLPDFDDAPTSIATAAVPASMPSDESILIDTTSLDDPAADELEDEEDDDAAAMTPVEGSPLVTEPIFASGGAWLDRGRQPTLEHITTQFEPGEIVPGTRYRIVQFIGDGGMGVVYEAEHLDLERRVALKVLHRSLTESAGAVKMFRAEARTASKIGAEQIVQLYDFAELPDGRVMFAMELLSGPTLFEALEDGPMAPARAIGILRQVCKGLSAAHRDKIVHRDVKPENVVLERRHGRPDAVKILDFGIATVLGSATDRPLAAGTPMYLAPELISGDAFDHRADVYAVGCMAYEMVTGRPPFDAGDGPVATVLRKHLEQRPTSPSALVDGVPESLAAVILRCLAKAPRDRFASVDALEVALCEAQVDARLVTPWDDLPLPASCDPATRERLIREIPQLRRTAPPRTRTTRWMWPAVAAASLLIGSASLFLALHRRQAQAPDPPVVVAEPSSPEPPAPDPVRALVVAARAAAAKSSFVVPLEDEPTAPTAYKLVLQLEALGGPRAAEAEAQARILRAEFADTLVRLGDTYWDREAGRPFAITHYRHALVFERAHPRALERAEVSPEDLVLLEARAAGATGLPEASGSPRAAAPESRRARGEGPRNRRLAPPTADRDADEAARSDLDGRAEADSVAAAPVAPTAVDPARGSVARRLPSDLLEPGALEEGPDPRAADVPAPSAVEQGAQVE